jgi:5'-deoxynucleotidase YfbR-like HD superfamily hydrolase
MKLLMGQDIKLEASYFRPTEEFILSEYEKAIFDLTINPANRLQRKIDKLEVEKTQFEVLAKKIAALESKIK